MDARIQTMALPNGGFALVLDSMPKELPEHEREYLVESTGAATVMCFPWRMEVLADDATATVNETEDLIDELNARRQVAGQLASAFGVLDQEDLVEVLSDMMRALEKHVAQTESDRDVALAALATLVELHVPDSEGAHCRGCWQTWPCTSDKILGSTVSTDVPAAGNDVVLPVSWSTKDTA